MAILSDEFNRPLEGKALDESPIRFVNEAEIPDRIKASAKEAGIPIAEAYADYLSRRERERAIAKAASELAIERTPGCPKGVYGQRIYSVDEMKSMSSTEVKKRYGAILESLKRGIEKLY